MDEVAIDNQNMQETIGILEKISHHDKLKMTVNENCKISLPEEVLDKLFLPHRLSYYHFVFMERGTDVYKIDFQQITISDGELSFALPGQILTNPPKDNDNQYHLCLDETALAQLPHAYPFLLDPLHTNKISFDTTARQRVKSLFASLFQLLHSPGKPRKTDVILAHLHTLLTEFNSAYFDADSPGSNPNGKLSKYIEFKLAVEKQFTELHDVHTIAQQLAVTTNNLYSIVKEYSGVSPKEWITNRLMLEAQRKLQYSALSVKEVAYELGFSDPDYFSRLFKKTTGKSVSEFISASRDLSGK